MPVRAVPFIAMALTAAWLAGCSGDEFGEVTFETPETAVAYEVALEGAPSEEIAALIEQSIDLYRQQENNAQSLPFLRRRGRGDVETIAKILRAHGYYEGTATVEITDPPVDPAEASPGAGPTATVRGTEDTPAPEEAEAETELPVVLVTVTVEPGRPYILARHAFVIDGDAALPSAQALGSPVGQPAAAAQILSAEAEAVTTLRNNGYPYAESAGRDAVADPQAAELEVETTIVSGPALVFGPIRFEGAEGIDEDYLRTYLPWQEGDVLDARKLREYQSELIATGMFDSGSVTPPDEAPEGPAAPITVKVEQRLPRSFSAGLRYSTDDGPAARLGFEYRNLFGAGEQLNADVIGGTEEQSLTVRFRKPQFFRDEQALLAGLELRRETTDAFDEVGGTVTMGIERQIYEGLTIGAGGLFEASETEQDGETTRSYLGGLPIFAEFDESNNLLNPTEGFRARIGLTPFGGTVDGEPAGFVLFDNRASAYLDLTGDEAYILAGRARLATIVGADVDTVPPQRRLYSGGGGSVRGYREKGIGPLDAGGDPTGGLSAAELGVELRARVYDDIGVAVFAEAGSVTEEAYPDFNEGVQIGAGAGVRYYSPVGPIRVDVGVPVNPRDEDDAFQVYISIGQAF